MTADSGDHGTGKFGRLRRLRVGGVRVPVEHPERVRGPRVRNAARLKELVGKIVDESRSGQPHHDVDAVEPPAPPRRPAAGSPPARSLLAGRFDESDDDEEDDG